MLFSPALDFLLNCIKSININDGFVRIGRVILRQLPIVYKSAFCEVIFTIFRLQQQVAGVCIVAKNTHYSAPMPYATLLRKYSSFIKRFHNCFNPLSRKKICINTFYDFSFFGNNNILTVLVSVAEHKSSPRLTLRKILTDSPFLIFTHRKAFFLGIGSKNTEYELTIRCHCINILLLKIYTNAHIFKFSYRLKESYRIPSKTAD